MSRFDTLFDQNKYQKQIQREEKSNEIQKDRNWIQNFPPLDVKWEAFLCHFHSIHTSSPYFCFIRRLLNLCRVESVFTHISGSSNLAPSSIWISFLQWRASKGAQFMEKFPFQSSTFFIWKLNLTALRHVQVVVISPKGIRQE